MFDGRDHIEQFGASPEAEAYLAAKLQQQRLKPTELGEAAWQTNEGFKIRDPVQLLSIYDKSIREKRVKLHRWQTLVMMTFAHKKEVDTVHRICVRANNGSGKSQFCIAPCAVWLGMSFIRSRSVVTSASGTQLDRQVGRKIVTLCQQINELHGQILWKINYRYLTFLPTGSTIELYATDDPQKAEGYHPHDVGAEFAMFVDEGKSVTEEIYQAILRCNGMTRRMDVSSPGGMRGHFHDINFSERWLKFVVTYRDCPHIKEDEVEDAKERFGESSPWFRSAYLAEFTSIEEDVVITLEAIKKCLREAQRFTFMSGHTYGGLDLAAGGDENVLSIWRGNVQIALECFRFDDTTITVDKLKRYFNDTKLALDPAKVFADDGGVGKSMIDMLWRDGYKVNRVLNQSAAYDTDAYANRGAELWFNFGRLITECDVVLMPDQTQINQLSSRYYKKGDVLGKIALESKRIARSKGHGSPDRADATVLAFANKSFPLIRSLSDREIENALQRPSTQTLIEEMQRQKCAYSGIDAALSGAGSNQHSLDYGELVNN